MGTKLLIFETLQFYLKTGSKIIFFSVVNQKKQHFYSYFKTNCGLAFVKLQIVLPPGRFELFTSFK